MPEALTEKSEENVVMTFEVTAGQLQKAQAWQAEHGCPVGPFFSKDPIGTSSLSFICTTTRILDIVIVQCGFCKKTLDITDWDKW